MIYVCGCLLSMLIAWIGVHTSSYRNGRRTTIVVSSLTPLFLISSLRYGVGTDYFYTYVPYFNLLEAGAYVKDKEPLFKLLNQIIIFFNGSSQWIFVFCGLLFLYFTYSQVFKDSPYPWVSISLLLGMTYYFISLNTVRQMVGIAILLYSIRFIEKKQLLKFLLCVLIATGFHYSCIVFIIAYLVSRLKLDLIRLVFATIIFLLLFLAIKDYLLSIISGTQYGWYIGSDFDNGTIGFYTITIQLVVFIFSTVYRNDTYKYRVYLNLQFISLILATIGSVIVLLERVRWMFSLPSIILLPLALDNIKNRKHRLIMGFIIILLFSLYATYTIGIKNGQEVLPYRTIFEV